MAAGFPKEFEFIGNVPVRRVDNTTASGFVEEPHVYHSIYMQLSDGWTLSSGHNVDAWLDKYGRVHTVSYKFQLGFRNWDDPQAVWVTCHEFGDMVVLDVETSDVTKELNDGPIVSDPLPKSLWPASRKHGMAYTRSGVVNMVGVVMIGDDGVITVTSDFKGDDFADGDLGGFYQFTVMYDKRA